ncbi:hypothetical protein [Deinococcus humi]|uniref:Uncharacterized protein n=1 Tax=Deinococcus humi TaxID=662880 RepID=A0A7W8JQP1_9DEIO|nr:hypothetical protein [Deinococcus humi]MBB5361180.1 hypothetical protein [Deinococcus humi]GGO18782.1 hypothetical protein GCM10008949_02490 [Deinococcus humi]
MFQDGEFFVLFNFAFLLEIAMDPFIMQHLLGTRDVIYFTLARRL